MLKSTGALVVAVITLLPFQGQAQETKEPAVAEARMAAAPAAACSLSKLVAEFKEWEAQRVKICKGAVKGSIPPSTAKAVQGCFDTHARPVLLNSTGLNHVVLECIVKTNAWSATSLCDATKQQAVTDCETKAFNANKSQLMKEIETNMGSICKPAHLLNTCMANVAK